MSQISDKKNRFPIFQERLRELQGRMNNVEFSEFLGMSRQTVGFYLNGDRIPDILGLVNIAQKCNVSADWLLGLTDIQSPDANIKQICEYTGLSEKNVEGLHFETHILHVSAAHNLTGYDCDDLIRINEILNHILSDLQTSEILYPLNQVLQSSKSLQSLLGEKASLDTFPIRLNDAFHELRRWRFESIDGFTNMIDRICYYQELSKQFWEKRSELTDLIVCMKATDNEDSKG